MTRLENYKERLQKAEENVAKREATIERHKAQLQKRLQKLQKVNWINIYNLDSYRYDMDARNRYKVETGSDLYWDICDVSDKEDDIKESYKKLAELQKIVSNWKEKIAQEELNEAVVNREIPESLKSYKVYLVNQWDEWDIKRRDKLAEEYRKLGYSEFVKTYKFAGYNFRTLTDEQIHQENEREAINLILDLYQRIFKYTGKVVSWEYLTIRQGHINGYVKGEQANVRVESILAGGYNIQRLHVRVLVHPYNEPITDAHEKKEYKDMTIEELEHLAEELGATYKKCDNSSINRMRLTMAIKKMAN